tara:strand:- start:1831 stop:3534 length:1704 start_codon:yes stop_codon:yes gene_type:complete
MPILSDIDERSRLQRIIDTRDIYGPEGYTESSFGETFAAAFQNVILEEQSISSIYGNEGLNLRKQKVVDLRNDGFDLNPYINTRGRIDYDGIARDTGLIRTDAEINEERIEYFKEKREQNQKILDRGSGLAQFFGGLSGYALDPINILTLPFGVGTAFKGLGVLATTLRASRNSAAIGVATELAIQPLVYKHKHDIESPYEFSDALTAIGSVAVTSGLLGGAAGGLGAYLRKARQKSAEFVDVGQKNEIESLDALRQLENQLALQKDFEPPRVNDVVLTEYDKFAAKQDLKNVKEQQKTRQETIKALEKQKRQIQKENPSMAKFLADLGGINAKSFIKEGVNSDSVAEFSNKRKRGFQKQFFKKGDTVRSVAGRVVDGGLEPDDLAEKVRELQQSEGFLVTIRDFGVDDAVSLVDQVTRNPQMLKTELAEGQIKAIERELDELQMSEFNFEEYYERVIQENIDADIAILEANEKVRLEREKPSLSYEDYVVDEPPKAPIATTNSLQRSFLEREGIAENFDRDIADYNTLGVKQAEKDGKKVDADKIIKELDDDIDGLESVRVCALGD